MTNKHSPQSFVFLHAHPDDEAIFTGGTITKLTDQGATVTVIVATDDPCGANRRGEAETSGEILKINRIEFLGYPDSGLGPITDKACFAATPITKAARRVAHIIEQVQADALVIYEPGGIYGHPDHLCAHKVGHSAAEATGIPTVYETTVDREHLHFVATHLVDDAVESLMGATETNRPEGLLGDPLKSMNQPSDGKLAGGTPTVLIDLTIDVTDVLDRKRNAMAAHLSQIPPESQVLQLDPKTFAAVYGHEWYMRSGPPTMLDRLADHSQGHGRRPSPIE